ncbi:hypothetical protein AAEU28_16925 [Pseudoalteromonas sp. SS15]|uniref:hypothetical protein n=1 Tax=Pseudoalteromonas sp. SS15 TaxID=3139393 RepID=UPI003BA965C5
MQTLASIKSASITIKNSTSKVLSFWQSLTLPQRFYLIAFLIFSPEIPDLISGVFGGHDAHKNSESIVWANSFRTSTYLLTLAILIGLICELWPRIVKFWESTVGKTVTFIFYAFLANYALAYASGTINDITGVSAEHFPYTHNLSLILSIPTWFMISTSMVLVLIPLLQPIYMAFLLLMRPFGLHTRWHPPEYRFPIITSVVRMFLCTILAVFFFVMSISSGVAGSMNTIFSTLVSNFTPVKVTYGIRKFDQEQPSAVDNSAMSNPEKSKATLNTDSDEIDKELKLYNERVNNYDNRIKQILAYFIYELEADSYSRCLVTPGRRVVELNDYDILEIWPIEGKEKAYHFEVKPCISPGIKLHLSSQAKALY